MSVSFSSGSIENLKSQINIVDVVGRVVSLKKTGSNYKGVCPFHNEKTPSFVVSEQKQIFTCFGCGATGDVIEFTKKYYNLEFTEAIEKLASEYGIQMERREKNDSREIYYKVNKMAANFFYRAFTEKANKGYPYMKRRGITPAILKKFGIGYADEQWDSLYKYLLSQKVDKKIMLQLGLVAESKGKCYDKFRNRVIFPIINTRGKVIGFGGRAINPDDNPKYLNSPESPVFQKKNNLYGLNISKHDVGKEDYIILVEGYMDVIALYQSGIENIAASLGTALTENQAKLITRYTKNVILSYDADSAGRSAAMRGLDILKPAGCKVKVLHVTDGKDPDEYVKKNGRKAFLNLVEGALPYGEYKLENAKSGFDLSKDEDKIDYLKKAASIINSLSPVEQEIYIKHVASDVHISESAIRMELSGNKENPEIRPRPVRTDKPDENSEELKINSIEKTLLKILFTDEMFIEKLQNHTEVMVHPFARKLYDILAGMYDENGRVDIDEVREKLSYKENEELNEILEEVLLGGNENKVFEDCMKKWKDVSLAKEEKKIITLLSMADEEDNYDSIRELTDKLMEIQRERKNNSRG